MANPDMPLYLTASYQERQFGGGVPGGPTVFQALVTPPETGEAAEDAAEEKAVELGVNQPNSAARDRQFKHRDEIRDVYDAASILRAAP